MRKMLVAGVLVVVLAALGGLVAGCGKQAAQTPTPAVTLKLAHQWPQDPNDYVIATGIKFAEEVEKRTGGKVKIEFYPAESLVKAKDIHTSMKAGTLDMAIYPYIYAAGAIPELNLVLTPGIWKSHDEFFRFKDSEPMKYLEEKLNKELNIKTLCWIQISGGIASAKKPVRTPQDVAGLKWRAAGKYTEAMLAALGGGITSMPSSEIYPAMQRGLLDAVLTSSSSFGAYKIPEVAKFYLSPEDYSFYFTCEPICISMSAWQRLTPQQQEIMLQVGRELEGFALEGAKKEDARVAKMFADAGAKVEKMTRDQWKAFFDAARTYSHPKFIKEVPNGEELLKKTLALYGS